MSDLIIVGGGPVGLVVALHAQQAGLSVTVIERRRQPVAKACGEGIMPAGLSILRALGVDPPGHEIEGIRYLDSSGSAETRFSAGVGRGVRRTTLQEHLTAATGEATVVAGAVAAVSQDPAGVTVTLGDGRQLTAEYLVGADGLRSTVRATTSLDPTLPRPIGASGLRSLVRATAGLDPTARRRTGLSRHYRLPPWTSHVEVYWADEAEAYVTPVADDEINVAVLSARVGGFDEHLAAFPALRDRLAGCEATPALGAGPFRQRSSARTSGRVLLVGDAAGYVDALTGEGLTVGWRQARAAVDAIVAREPAEYERKWRSITRRSTLLTTGLVHATRVGPVRQLILPSARRLPWAFRTLVDLAAQG